MEQDLVFLLPYPLMPLLLRPYLHVPPCSSRRWPHPLSPLLLQRPPRLSMPPATCHPEQEEGKIEEERCGEEGEELAVDMWGPHGSHSSYWQKKNDHYTAEGSKLTQYYELWDGLYLMFSVQG